MKNPAITVDEGYLHRESDLKPGDYFLSWNYGRPVAFF